MRKLTIGVVVALLAIAALYAWRSGGLGAHVATVEARRGLAAEVVYATGVVEPQRWAKVIALQRKRIVELCNCEGRTVKTGDTLGRLDDVEERAVLSELEARQRRLTLDVERIRGLVARAAAPQTQLDQTITQLQEFEARIAAQKDRIADLVLRAPMDGVVLRADGEVGEIAGTGPGDVLFWIGPPRPLRIVADVNEDDIPRVRKGQKVLLRSEGFKGDALAATVADITPKGDPATKTFRVYLALPDDTPLKIGMSVEANIVTREKENVVVIPSEAIIDGHVFALRAGALARTKVETGVRGVRMVEIVSGLAEGQRIASPATAAMHDGQRVRDDAKP